MQYIASVSILNKPLCIHAAG